jgi:hypothetical protein
MRMTMTRTALDEEITALKHLVDERMAAITLAAAEFATANGTSLRVNELLKGARRALSRQADEWSKIEVAPSDFD